MTKVISECSPENALWAAEEFINYFKNFSSIEDYLRFAKGEAVSSVGVLGGISDKDKFFNEDIHPEDMEFEIKNVGDRFNDGVSQDFYIKYLTATSVSYTHLTLPTIYSV